MSDSSRQFETPLDQIFVLRDLFRRTGAVHDLHRLNLWVWAELTSPHLVVSQVEIKPESFEVVFDYEPNKKVMGLFKVRPPKDFLKRIEGLEAAVRVMFGDDYSVQLRLSGQPIFLGGKKTAPKARPEYTGVDFEAGRLVPTKPWVFQKPKVKKQ